MSNKFDQEELDILESFENGEWESAPDFEQRKNELEASADYTLKKNKRVNIRMSERDMMEIKKIANEEGLPYQTLISSVLHKYINGRLVVK